MCRPPIVATLFSSCQTRRRLSRILHLSGLRASIWSTVMSDGRHASVSTERRMQTRIVLWAGLVTVTLSASANQPSPSRPSGEWRWHGGDSGSTRYSALDQITRNNVSQLRVAWRRPAVDASLIGSARRTSRSSHDFRATPLMIDGVLYASNGIGLVEAFDPAPAERSGCSSRFPTNRSAV